jgi:hypothetical protein
LLRTKLKTDPLRRAGSGQESFSLLEWFEDQEKWPSSYQRAEKQMETLSHIGARSVELPRCAACGI